MRVRVLGPLEVVSADGTPRVVRGSRRRLLLATLILHRNGVCGADQLVDALFGDKPPERALGTMQSYISRLRRDLGPESSRVLSHPGGYSLLVSDDEIDQRDVRAIGARVQRSVETRPCSSRAASRRGTRLVAWRTSLRRVRRQPRVAGREHPAGGATSAGKRAARRRPLGAVELHCGHRSARKLHRAVAIARTLPVPADARSLWVGPTARGTRASTAASDQSSAVSSGSNPLLHWPSWRLECCARIRASPRGR